jgi:hypothetical protein
MHIYLPFTAHEETTNFILNIEKDTFFAGYIIKGRKV